MFTEKSEIELLENLIPISSWNVWDKVELFEEIYILSDEEFMKRHDDWWSKFFD